MPRNEPLQRVQRRRDRERLPSGARAGRASCCVGPVSLRVLHPPLPDWERQRVRNDDSVVLEVRFGNVSVILPGDIGKEGERALLDHVEPAPPRRS